MINRLKIRQKAEERESQLSPFAARSNLSQGRLIYEEPDAIRTSFQRDRDRIIHAKAFRRLKHKTQVFIAPLGDHYVTRLTHTLEVSQLARTMARALNLNEDLAEAISMGHDLGHTPFGHIGEDVLGELHPQGFRHYEQSLRVVDTLENDGQGLNLTLEVRDGILNHSKSAEAIGDAHWGKVSTLEGEVVKISDVVAYVNHDIGDAIRAGIITEKNLPPEASRVLGSSHRERINTMVCDIIEQSWEVAGYTGSTDRSSIRMGSEVVLATNDLRRFLFDRVYKIVSSQADAERARQVVRRLYGYFTEHGGNLPPEYQLCDEDFQLGVVDYIAGMTDQYALNLARELSL